MDPRHTYLVGLLFGFVIGFCVAVLIISPSAHAGVLCHERELSDHECKPPILKRAVERIGAIINSLARTAALRGIHTIIVTTILIESISLSTLGTKTAMMALIPSQSQWRIQLNVMPRDIAATFISGRITG